MPGRCLLIEAQAIALLSEAPRQIGDRSLGKQAIPLEGCAIALLRQTATCYQSKFWQG